MLVSDVQQSDSVTHIYILCYHRLLQDTDYSSLGYVKGEGRGGCCGSLEQGYLTKEELRECPPDAVTLERDWSVRLRRNHSREAGWTEFHPEVTACVERGPKSRDWPVPGISISLGLWEQRGVSLRERVGQNVR